jgi:hypothetical protein
MLLLACACKPEDADNADNAEVGSTTDTTDKETDKKTEADPQLKATDILLSDADSPVRIVYAEGFKSAANKIYDRLIALDKNFTIGKYAVVPDSAAESGLPEIVVGDTKHEASAEAKKLITESGCFYSVYASGNKIAVYLTDTDGIENAAAAVVKKIVKRGNAVVYDNAEGNFIGEFERTNLLKKLVKTAKNEGLPVYRISVYDENGLQTETINSSNPC